MRSYPSSWTKTLAKLGFRRQRRTNSRPQTNRVNRVEMLEKREMLAADLPVLSDMNATVVFRVETAATADPADLSLDSSVIAAGGVVSEWEDLSGNNYDLAGLGDKQPSSTTETTPSGKAAITFDGDDRLIRGANEGTGISLLPGGDSDRTMFLAARFDDITPGEDTLAGASYGRWNSALDRSFGVGVNDTSSGGAYAIQTGVDSGSGSQVYEDTRSSPPDPYTAGWTVLTAKYESGTLSLYQDGNEIATQSIAALTTVLTAIGQLNGQDTVAKSRIVLGQEVDGDGGAKMDVAAWLIYDKALNDTDRGAVEDYLTTTYLESNQPPVNQPPVAQPSSVTTLEDTAHMFDHSEFMFTDAENDQLTSVTVSGLSGLNGGTLHLATPSPTPITEGQIIQDASLIDLVYTPPADDSGASLASFDFTVNSGTESATMTITVTPVNDAPALTQAIPQFTTINEDDIANSGNLVSDLLASSVADVDAGALEGIAITGAGNSGNGTWQYNIGGDWLDVGSVSTSSALLLRDADRLRLSPDAENGEFGSIDFVAWDQTNGTFGTKVDANERGGSSAFSALTDSAVITVTDVNDSPVITLTGQSPLDYNEDAGPVQLTTLTIADSDDTHLNSATVEITGGYQPEQDVLAFANTATITGNWIDANGTLTLTGTDTVDNYRAALEAVTYENTSQNPGTGTRSITFTVNDGDLDSISPSIVNVEITADNDAPVLIPYESDELDYTEGDPATPVTSELSITDFDDTHLLSATIQITGNYRPGEDRLEFDNAGNITHTWDEGDGKLTLTGNDTVANYEAALLAVTYVNNLQNPDTSNRRVSFTVNDGDSNSITRHRYIYITAVNDQPVLDNSGDMRLTNVAMNSSNPAGDAVATIIQSAGGDRITDPDGPSLEGIAVTAVDNTNGTWEFDAGGGWTAFDVAGPLSDSNAVLLASAAKIRFKPNPDFFGSAGNVTFRAWDRPVGNSGTSGDTGVDASGFNSDSSAFSVDIEVATLDVAIAVNTYVDDADSDPTDGIVATGSSEISLRAAIQEANQRDLAETVVILLPADSYQLELDGDEAAGNPDAVNDLDISSRIRIVGAGVGQTIIDADSLGMGMAGADNRGFHVSGVGNSLELVGLTVRDGNVVGTGGAILADSNSTVILNDVEIIKNTATGRGGGLYAKDATVDITHSTFDSNTSTGDTGGGVYFRNDGADATFTAFGSAFSNNEADKRGNGLALVTLQADPTVPLIQNSTISNNTGTEGGAIYVAGNVTHSVNIVNSTIVENHSDQPSHPAGLWVLAQGQSTINNTILAGNTSGSSVYDFHQNNGTVTGGFNLIEDTGGPIAAAFLNASNNTELVNYEAAMLRPLGDYGGPTQTHALIAGSPAIDAGDASAAAGLATDQRGVSRFLDFPAGNATPNNNVDIGAVETNIVRFVVNDTEDLSEPAGATVGDGIVDVDTVKDGNQVTLRAAIEEANELRSNGLTSTVVILLAILPTN